MEPDALTALSRRTAALVAERSPHVVRVDGRHRGPASGVVWSPDGLVVTTHHALERDEELEVGLPSGDTAPAELVGRDPTTDLALLRVGAPGSPAVEWSDGGARPRASSSLAISRPGRSSARRARPRRARRRTSTAPRAAAGSTAGSRRRSTSPRASPARSPPVRRRHRARARHRGPRARRGDDRPARDAAARRRRARRARRGPARVPRGRDVPGPARRRSRRRRASPPRSSCPASSPRARRPARGAARGRAPLPRRRAGPEPGDLLPLLEEERIGLPLPVRLVRAGEVREVTSRWASAGSAPGGGRDRAPGLLRGPRGPRRRRRALGRRGRARARPGLGRRARAGRVRPHERARRRGRRPAPRPALRARASCAGALVGADERTDLAVVRADASGPPGAPARRAAAPRRRGGPRDREPARLRAIGLARGRLRAPPEPAARRAARCSRGSSRPTRR